MSPDDIKALEDKIDSMAIDVKEIRTVLLGVPDTDDKGVVGKVNDVCDNHVALKNKVYLAGGVIIREKIRRDTSSEFEGEMEIISEGSTLYREVKETGLSKTAHIIE